MALFPILTSGGDTILTSDGDAVVVSAGLSPQTGTALFVPSDGSPPAAIIDPSTGAILNEVTFFSLSGAARLPDGTFATLNLNSTSAINIWQWQGGTSFQTIATFAGGNVYAGSPFAAIGTNFWTCTGIGGFTNTPTFYRFDRTGAISKTVGPITFLSDGVQSFTPSLTESVAYYNNADDNSAIHVWDLVNNVALPDLVANLGDANTFVQGLVAVPGSTDIVAVLVADDFVATNTRHIRRYTTSGSIVYDVIFAALATTNDILADVAVDPSLTSIWVRWPGPPDYDTTISSTFTRLNLADGATLQSVRTIRDISGAPAVTCPLLVLSSGLNGTTFPIRRLRRFMLPWSNNFEMFISRLEIQMQTGVGLVTGQGSDPTVMLRFSKDGGMTWGPEIDMSAGMIGEYLHRVYVNRLGRARQPVVEITTSDPVLWGFLACLVDIEQGSN